MHYLHPRSRTTGTLFTTTLAVSFLVVALPHLLPCPADRRQFADTIEMPDGTLKRRRRKNPAAVTTEDAEAAAPTVDGPVEVLGAGDKDSGRPKRECPVPKPGGLVGKVMGFEQRERERTAEVVVQRLQREQGDGRDGVAEKP